MTESTLVSFGGDELELKKINARQYLSAGMEAKKLSLEYGGNDVSDAIILGACLLSEGLFNSEGRAFASAQEILDSVTAEEIIETADSIELEAGTKAGIIEKAEKVRRSVLQAGSMPEDDYIRQGETEDHPAPENKKENNPPDDDKTVRRELPPREERRENESGRPEVRNKGLSEYKNRHAGTSAAFYGSSLSPRNEMRRVSDFFQRDSRRYDGEITSY